MTFFAKILSLFLSVFFLMLPQIAKAENPEPPFQHLENGAIHLPISESCALPPVPEGADVVILANNRGQNLASMALEGQMKETTYAQISIEREDPVYLIIAADHAVIWDIEGPVMQLVATLHEEENLRYRGYSTEAGIIGVAPEDIFFINAYCRIIRDIRSIGNNHPRAIYTRRHIEDTLDISSYIYSGFFEDFTKIIISDNTVEYDSIRQDFPESYSGADTPIIISPETLVASSPAEAYITYPGRHGLTQLLEEGLILAAETSDFSSWMLGYLRQENIDLEIIRTTAAALHPHYSSGYGYPNMFFIIAGDVQLPASEVADYSYHAPFWLVPENTSLPYDPEASHCIFNMADFSFLGPDTCPALLTRY